MADGSNERPQFEQVAVSRMPDHINGRAFVKGIIAMPLARELSL